MTRKIRVKGHRWADLGPDLSGWPSQEFRCDFCGTTTHLKLTIQAAPFEPFAHTLYHYIQNPCPQHFRRWWQR